MPTAAPSGRLGTGQFPLAFLMSCLVLMTQSITCSTAMTTVEEQEIVDIHNSKRRNEGASNMEIMTWNPTLAVIAQNWSDACDFVHGQGVNSSTLGDLGIGQNNYATTASPISLTDGVLAWFGEKTDFTYTTNTCTPGAVCGHYTQVVWAKSNEVGCGYTVCPELTGTTTPMFNAAFLVCNYAPGGNVYKEIPYLKGAPCTQCSSGQFFCNSGLCDDSCTAPSANCVCSAGCKNCATQTADCRCQCGTGWAGVDCSAVCADTDTKCNNNGWPTSWCVPTYPFVLDACPATCQLCVAGTPAPCAATVTTAATARPPVYPPGISGQNYGQKLKVGACLISRASGIPLRTNAVVKKFKKGRKFIFLGMRKTMNGEQWLKVASMPGRSPVGWVESRSVRHSYRVGKFRGNKRPCQ